MSGICGIFDLEGGRREEEAVLNKMLRAIHHRGPDGDRTLILDGVAMGFCQSAGLDLKDCAQPVRDEERQLAMVCSGEIYNLDDLRAQRKAPELSDAQLLFQLYEEQGEDFVKELNGQFSIALYDGRQRQMLLIRDHVGVGPMYYTVVDHKVIFASEIKAILEYPGVERKLELKALDQLMNYPGVVAPITFFKGIYALRGGHMLRLRPQRDVEDVEFWDMIFPVEEEEDRGEEYYTETLRGLLRDAIACRVKADVPTGFYISGGLDSSVVACFVKHFGLDSHYSFSAEIGSGKLDESRFQKIVLDKVGSNHFITKVAEQEIWDNLPEVIYHAESGVKESYDTAAFLLSKLVLDSPVKAVLTGQGSDEFFCGYVGYMLDQFRAMQRSKMTPEECEANERLWGDPYFRYERIHPALRATDRQLYSADLRGEIDSFSAWAESPVNVSRLKGLSDQKRRSYIDSKLRLGDHLLLEHGDRMTAAHGIEGRHPFLDARVLDFVAKLPDKYKLNGTNEKYIIKKAGKGIVPDQILKRKKFPFQAPGMSSMVKQAHGALLAGGRDFLSDDLLKKQGIFDVDYVHKLLELYSRDDFQLMGAYEIDYPLIVMTVTILCERYGLSL